MLWEPSVTEQRYRAVLEVRAGAPVTEVAERYGVSRQSVHAWLRRCRGPPGWPSAVAAGDGHRGRGGPDGQCCGAGWPGGTQVSVGFDLAGQRVTLRMDGTQMALIGQDGTLLRTVPCPVSAAQRRRLRGARRAASMPKPSGGPVVVQRRVSQRGQIMVATQRIQVGMTHARKIVTVTASDHSFRLDIDGQTVATVPRTASAEIHLYKAYATQPRLSSEHGH